MYNDNTMPLTARNLKSLFSHFACCASFSFESTQTQDIKASRTSKTQELKFDVYISTASKDKNYGFIHHVSDE